MPVVVDAHISREDDPAQYDPFVVCDVCGEHLCTVEEGDSISVLASVVADHAQEKHERERLGYKIVRFRFNGENETIVTGLTLEQAQAHCERPDTHGEGWFDGYLKEEES
jgi:hypothetical protein